MAGGASASWRRNVRMMVPLALLRTTGSVPQSFGQEDIGMTTDWGRLEEIATQTEADRLAGRMAVAVRFRGNGSEPVRWNCRGDEPFLSASTIKVAILIAVARAIDAGTLRHGERRSARPVDTIAGSGVLKGMEPGLSLTIDDHAYLMVAVSDNTASNVLIEAVGRETVQSVIESMDLTGTHLRRAFLGHLPSNDLPRNQTTANDLVTMLTAIADDEAASPDACRWMRKLLREQQHVDRLGRDLPSGVTFSGKSGSLEGTVHDCAILEGPDGQLIIAGLTSEVRNPYDIDAVFGQLGRIAVLITGIGNVTDD
jgi:beta-lactamase class A